MTRQVALLRGINVGGKNIVAMSALRELFTSLGCTAVSTYIQSGNVVFTPPRPRPLTEATLESAIGDRFGVVTRVALRVPADLDRVLAGNPFPGADPAYLHVGFMAAEPPAGGARLLATGGPGEARPVPGPGEEWAVRDREVYLYLPAGMARTKLPAQLDRRLGPMTFRNWRTLTKLGELVAELAVDRQGR